MMWYWGNGAHWWGWLIGLVAMVAFWGVIGWAIWYLVTSFVRRPEEGTPPPTSDAQRILDERLARGEITPEVYGQLRDLIRNGGGPEGNPQTPVGATGPQRQP